MKKSFMKLICALILVCLTVPMLLVQTVVPASATPTDSAVLSPQDGVTLHCWNWSFKEIEDNMEIIASLGYTSIQTSPIQQAKQATLGYPSNDWWVFYQPAAFHIDDSGESALGTKSDFQSMCKRAHEYGIKVIVDVVANHMGNTESGTNGLAATIIPDLRGDTSCWNEILKNTANYTNRQEVTKYCMSGLPDLNTSNKKVQNYVLNFLKECIDAGADGFRFDAAKHIETPDDGALGSDFWPTVVNGAKEYAQTRRGISLYCYGELLDDVGGNLTPAAYTKYMSVTDNIWSAGALSAVNYGKAGTFSANYRNSKNASELVLWAESHDTYADGTTSNVSEENINKTWALIAARAGAMSLYLARPANMSQLLGAASNTGWAYPEVAAVNKFHTKFVGTSEYVANEGNIAYVERGTSGVVLVNCNGNEAQVSVAAHNIANGTYTDLITGNTFTVADGKISGTIGSTGIAVVTEGKACVHTDHDAEGFCLICRANVGHSYDDNGICACGDKKVSLRTIYFVNKGKWKKVNFYSWYDAINIFTGAWPGNSMVAMEDGVYSCEVPVDVPNIIFNDTGSTQTDDLLVPDVSTGLNMYDYATGKWGTYGQEQTTPEQPEQPDAGDSDADEAPDNQVTDTPNEGENIGSNQQQENNGGAGESDSDSIDWVLILVVAVVAVVLTAGAVLALVLISKKK